MRQFQDLVQELKTVAANHRPGQTLVAPSLLKFVEHEGRKIHYASMGLPPGLPPGLPLKLPAGLSSGVSPVSTSNSKPGPPLQAEAEADSETSPIVLVHGFGGFFMDWPRVMAPISRHTQVYALDLPGWGFSDTNVNASAIEDDVHALEAFIAGLGLKNVILCGLSYGAGVAWAAAAMNSKSIREVVLLNPMPTYPLDFMKSIVYKGIFLMGLNARICKLVHGLMPKSQYKVVCKESLLNFRLLDSFYLDLAYKVIKQPKLSFVLHQQAVGARQVNWAKWEERLSYIRMPVTIMQGKQDRLFSMASARHMQSLIPGAQLIEVDNCGHAMVFDQHRKVSDFLIERVHALATSQSSSGSALDAG